MQILFVILIFIILKKGENDMLLSFFSSYSIVINIFIMIVAFALTGIAYYSLAKKRNISKPWIAWIPVVQTYMIGKISDDINIKYNKKTHRGRWSLVFTIAYIVFSVIAISFIATLLVSIISSIDLSSLNLMSTDLSSEELNSNLLTNSQSIISSFLSGINIGLIITALISGLIFVVTAIISMVFQMISWYSVYNEYNSKKASIYLVIAIIGLILLGSTILAPIFVLISCKNTPQFEILNSSSSYQSISSEQK